MRRQSCLLLTRLPLAVMPLLTLLLQLAFVAEDACKVASGQAPSKPPGVGVPKRKRKLSDSAAVGAVSPAGGVAAAVAACDELQFSAALFSAVQSRLRKPCTVDACASDGGGNALLPRFHSP